MYSVWAHNVLVSPFIGHLLLLLSDRIASTSATIAELVQPLPRSLRIVNNNAFESALSILSPVLRERTSDVFF